VVPDVAPSVRAPAAAHRAVEEVALALVQPPEAVATRAVAPAVAAVRLPVPVAAAQPTINVFPGRSSLHIARLLPPARRQPNLF
jgi:hypothetical protein